MAEDQKSEKQKRIPQAYDPLMNDCAAAIEAKHGKEPLPQYDMALENVAALLFDFFPNIAFIEVGSEKAFAHDDAVKCIDFTLATPDYCFDVFISNENQRYSKLPYHKKDLPEQAINELIYNAAIDEWDVAILTKVDAEVPEYYLYRQYNNWNLYVRIVFKAKTTADCTTA